MHQKENMRVYKEIGQPRCDHKESPPRPDHRSVQASSDATSAAINDGPSDAFDQHSLGVDSQFTPGYADQLPPLHVDRALPCGSYCRSWRFGPEYSPAGRCGMQERRGMTQPVSHADREVAAAESCPAVPHRLFPGAAATSP